MVGLAGRSNTWEITIMSWCDSAQSAHPCGVTHPCVCRAEGKDLHSCLTLVAFPFHTVTSCKKSSGEFGVEFLVLLKASWWLQMSHVFRAGCLPEFAMWILWHSWAQIACPSCALNTRTFFLFPVWNSWLLEALGIVLQEAPQEELKPQNRMFWVGKQRNLTCFAILKW